MYLIIGGKLGYVIQVTKLSFRTFVFTSSEGTANRFIVHVHGKMSCFQHMPEIAISLAAPGHRESILLPINLISEKRMQGVLYFCTLRKP